MQHQYFNCQATISSIWGSFLLKKYAARKKRRSIKKMADIVIPFIQIIEEQIIGSK